MCGIVGYIGNNSIEENLLNNLNLLEYRGYDSAGIAVLENHEIKLTKAVGCINNLKEKIKPSINATIGISHTRWATHGESTIENAHPHVSQNSNWAVVHNGIIENYAELKNDLIKDNFIFKSETDTEVIPQLLQHLDCNNNIKTLIDTCNKLEGSFALAVINKNVSDTLYLAKRKSPLYISANENEIFIASDPICFAAKTETYFALNDDEFCEAKLNNIKFYNSSCETIIKNPIPLNTFEENLGKQNYNHFMLKEIDETSKVLNRIVLTYKDNCVFDKINKDLLNNINKVILIGCGTAYHACLMGAHYLESFARIEARCYISSEFRYSNPIIDNKTLAIFVSQSGETADTLMAHELSKQKGAKTVAITNVLYSTLSKAADYVFSVCAGPEIAVASTKAYSAQVAVLNMFAKYLSNLLRDSKYDYLNDILTLSKNLKILDVENLELLAEDIAKQSSALFIGRNLDHITCEEASLKLKEITYINTHAHPAGELKHGFLAVVEQGTPVFVIATQKALLDKTLNAASEAAARGAKIIVASQFNIEEKNIKNLFYNIKLQEFDEDLMAITAMYSFQMLSYLTSIKRGIDPDKPRNLAKSVTVE